MQTATREKNANKEISTLEIEFMYVCNITRKKNWISVKILKCLSSLCFQSNLVDSHIVRRHIDHIKARSQTTEILKDHEWLDSTVSKIQVVQLKNLQSL